MSIFVILVGAAGLALTLTGAPPLRRPTLADRVGPYLPGASQVRHVAPTRILQRLAARLPGHDRELQSRLDSAGLDLSPLSFRTEQLAWALLALAGTAGLTIFLAAVGVGLDPASAPLLAPLSCASGYYARDWWLGKQSQARRAAIKEELPSAIDLLALALIAGESPNAAINRVGSAIGGDLGEEFGRIVADVRAGEPLSEALQNCKARTVDATMVRFLDALSTGIERGSPLAEVLRAQADDARHARGRELLEVAGRKEVLMLVPVVFLIMPVVVVYALFPGLASLDLFVK